MSEWACETCVHYPSSSCDGKPCCVCEPDDPYLNCYQKQEDEYEDAVNGDIYLNPGFGDMWIVNDGRFIKINDGCVIDFNEPVGFIKVGHVDGVINVKSKDSFIEEIL